LGRIGNGRGKIAVIMDSRDQTLIPYRVFASRLHPRGQALRGKESMTPRKVLGLTIKARR